MIPIQTTYLKPRSGWILAALLPVAVFAFISTEVNGDEPLLKIMFGIFLTIPVGMYVFSMRSFVQIDNDGITHKTPFKQKSFLWKEVTQSYFRIRYTGKSTQRLWVFKNAAEQTFHFSVGMYSRSSLQSIAEAVVNKCANAELDPNIRKFAEGKFPWHIF